MEAKRSDWRPLSLIAAAALLGLCVLGGLVAAGRLSGVDTYAIRHLMPYATVEGNGATRSLGGLLGFSRLHWRFGDVLATVADPGPASVLMIVLCGLLWRRGRRALAVLWLVAFGVANIAEGLGKVLITKPQLFGVYNGSVTPAGFHHSFPSGHTARAAVLAATAVCLWRRLWPAFAALLIAIVVTLELYGAHTPSDLAGGLLLAVGLILGTVAVDRRWGDALDRTLTLKPPAKAASDST